MSLFFINLVDIKTVLRDSAALYFMEQAPFTKIRNLGGKLGSEIESSLSIDKASDLWYIQAFNCVK